MSRLRLLARAAVLAAGLEPQLRTIVSVRPRTRGPGGHRIVTPYASILSLATVLALMACAPAQAGQASAPPPGGPRDRIVAAVPEDMPPTYFRDPATGRAAGFAVDLLDEVAKLAGLRVDYVFGRPWDEIHQMVLDGRADVIPNLAVNAERAKAFAFTSAVETLNVSFVARASDRDTGGPLPGMKIGVIRASSAEEYQKTRPELTPVYADNMGALLFDLLAGRVDLALTAEANILKFAIDAGVDDRIRILEPPVLEGRRAIALRQDDVALLQRLDTAVDRFVNTPRYREVYVKWWGKPAPYWTARRIVLAMSGLIALTLVAMSYWRYRSLGAMNRSLRAEVEERRAAVAALAAEKERLAVTLRSIGDAVIVTDVEGAITMVNKAAENLVGLRLENAAGRPLRDVFKVVDGRTREPIANPVDEVVRTGLVCGLGGHTVLTGADGREFDIEHSAAPIRDQDSRIRGVVLVFRDTTERRHLDEELARIEKLKSVGLLAGGIAHDFNNLLMGVLGNISLAKADLSPSERAHHRMVEAEGACRRATDLTYQLLTFAKGGTPVRNVTRIADVVRESANFVLSGTNVAARYEFPDDLWNADIDAGQISQVFGNLVLNAVQAMPGGGTITCTAVNASVRQHEVPSLEAGLYVKVTVADTGVGIPRELVGRIFEPYFTTKQTGSGLGLASVYAIAKSHGGHVSVTSEPGAGTVFTLYLPATLESLRVESVVAGAADSGRGRVLVMDDEPLILSVTCEMLKRVGYIPVPVANGDEAVATYRKALDDGERFDAVILDLTIPGGVGGAETLARLRELDPEVAAVVSSGYSNDTVMAEYAKYGFKAVVVKPYDLQTIAKTLRQMLAPPPSPSTNA